jgi:hypothetical protein
MNQREELECRGEMCLRDTDPLINNVMINFMGQPDWAKGYQMAGKTLFLVLVRVFLEEISLSIRRLSKEELSSPTLAGICGRFKQNKKVEQSWEIHPLMPSDTGAPGSWTLGF